MSKTVTENCDSCLFSRTLTVNVSEQYGGSVTERADNMPSGHNTIVVDPNGIKDRSDAPQATVGEATAHEFGRRAANLKGRFGFRSNRGAVDAENDARKRGGENRKQRHDHFGGFPE